MANPFGNKLYDDNGFDYEEMSGEGDELVGKSRASSFQADPLRKQKKMDFIGGEMDQLGFGVGTDTPYGRPGKKYEIPFEGQQAQALAPQRGIEEAIESAIDKEISNLDKAIKTADTVGEMKANTEIVRLQKELQKEMGISAKAQLSMGETYETEALKQRVKKASKNITEGELELMTEDARPLPTTSKGKGPGIKNAEAIIKTGLEAKKLPTKISEKTGEYLPSSTKQVSVEKALREGAGIGSPERKGIFSISEQIAASTGEPYKGRVNPYDYRDSLFGERGGILGQATPDAGKTYGRGPTFTGVDAQGNILQPKMPDRPDEGGTGIKVKKPDAPKTGGPGNMLKSEGLTEYPNMHPTGDEFDPYGGDGMGNDPTGSRSRMKGKFAGKKVSGNTVKAATPDAPKQVVSSNKTVPDEFIDDYNKFKSMGQPSQRALKLAQQEAKLKKIKGRGKGKGKLLTTLGAVGIGAIINKNK
jgi:hypothetical protein